MTADKLYETLQLMADLDRKFGLQKSLTQIKDSLTSLSNSPGASQFQQTLAQAREAFDDGASSLFKAIQPSESEAIAELGGKAYFDPKMAEDLHSWIKDNALTVSVARDRVSALVDSRAEFLGVVAQTLEGLETLLQPGLGEGGAPLAQAAFTIPRVIFSNSLGEFAGQIKFVNQLMERLGEAATGKAETVELRGLSSSSPMVEVLASLGALKLLADTVKSLLESWKVADEMLQGRSVIARLGLSKRALDEAEENIKGVAKRAVDQAVSRCLSQSPADDARKHELENSLTHDFKILLSRIERGMTVEVRTQEESADKNATKEQQAELKELRAVALSLRFPAPSSEPVLLTDGDEEDVGSASDGDSASSSSRKTRGKR